MHTHEVSSVADARTIAEERGIDYIKVGVSDVDAILRGKFMSRDRLFSALDDGFDCCDLVLGWDSNDHLYDHH